MMCSSHYHSFAFPGFTWERAVYRSSIVLLLFYFLGCNTSDKRDEYTWDGRTMGTTYQVKVAGAELGDKKFEKVKFQIDSVLKSVNKQMSTYDPQSEISLINKSRSTDPINVSQPFFVVLEAAMDLYLRSDGAFDVTVAPLVNLWGFGPAKSRNTAPTQSEIDKILQITGSENLVLSDQRMIQKQHPEIQIDLSAIAKGYGVDAVAEIMILNQFDNFMVEVGGEVRVKGKNAKNMCWRIGVDRPKHASFPGQDLQSILCLKDVAVATSGDYRNYFFSDGHYYSHAIDPETGYPVKHNLASVTIIASSCMLADGLATATMVLGPEKGYRFIKDIQDVEAMLIERIDEDNFEVKYTEGFGKYLD